MAPLAAFDPQVLSASWGLASAIGVALLGGLSLLGGRARPRGALAFGLYALLWGVHILAGSLLYVATSPGTAQTLYGVYLVTLLPLPYFLIEFASAQTGFRYARWGSILRWSAGGVAMLAGMALLFAPTLIFEGLQSAGSLYFARWGPLFAPLVLVPHVLAYVVALLALYDSFRTSPTPRTRLRVATLLAGLGFYAGFASGNNLTFYLLGAALYPDTTTWTDFLFIAAFGLMALVSATLGLRAITTARRAGVAQDRRLNLLSGAALLVPLSWGVIEGVDDILTASSFNSIGLWRLLGVGVIAYGLARWRIYDLPQRASSAAATAGGTAVAAVGGAAAYGAGSVVSSTGSSVPIVAGLIVLAAAVIPSVRFMRGFFARRQQARVPDLDQALYGQRIESYRAALEAALARGTLEEDEEFLSALRDRFSITDAEDRVLRYYARSSVIVPRSQEAWDAYERLRLLGEGGGGRTWLARDRARDRLVVLKEPLERWQQEATARDAVIREARLAAKVRHRHVVAIEEVLEGRGSPVIVMEYLEGGSLSDVLRARGALPWKDAVPLVVDVLSGLEAIHAAGVVHRDIKPSNVLLTGDGVAKIADFGIALTVGGSSQKTMVMDAGSSTIAGTVAYMAPEVRGGATPGDRRSDVYACAVLLHELVHGVPPGIPAPPGARVEVPAALTATIARGMAERPEQRYASARAFAEALAPLTRT